MQETQLDQADPVAYLWLGLREHNSRARQRGRSLGGGNGEEAVKTREDD
jgi:hypothetical protein